MSEKKNSVAKFLVAVLCFLGVLFLLGAHELYRDAQADKTVKAFVKLLVEGKYEEAYDSGAPKLRESMTYTEFLKLPLVQGLQSGKPIQVEEALAPGRYRVWFVDYLISDHQGKIYYEYQGNLFWATVTGSFKVTSID